MVNCLPLADFVGRISTVGVSKSNREYLFEKENLHEKKKNTNKFQSVDLKQENRRRAIRMNNGRIFYKWWINEEIYSNKWKQVHRFSMSFVFCIRFFRIFYIEVWDWYEYTTITNRNGIVSMIFYFIDMHVRFFIWIFRRCYHC